VNILKMTATFGKLENQELILSGGLNVIEAPNEFGKSTWAAFIFAMLYGIDSSERATKTSLPAKVKYKPWSGLPMEGSMEILWQNQKITIVRTTHGRILMGNFRVFDTITGENLDFLQGDNCGQVLLGVEARVFERSGFIRQQAMVITGDGALESRLTALVTSGEEDFSHSQIHRKLSDLRNRRRHNKTGLLPQAERELQSVEDNLAEISSLGQDNLALQAQEVSLTQKEATIKASLQSQKSADLRKRQAQLHIAKADFESKQDALADDYRAISQLPTAVELGKLRADAQHLKRLMEELATDTLSTAPPVCPKGFEGLSADGVRRQAQEHAETLEHISIKKPKQLLFLKILWVLLFIFLFAFLGSFSSMYWTIIGAVFGCAISLVIWKICTIKKAISMMNKESSSILPIYGVVNGQSILSIANKYREVLLLNNQIHQQNDGKRQSLERDMDGLFDQVRRFSPYVSNLSDAMTAMDEASSKHRKHETAALESRQAQAQYEALVSALGTLSAVELPPTQTIFETHSQQDLDAVTYDLQSLRGRLERQRGRMSAIGDIAVWAATKEQLQERIAQLEKEYTALIFAIEALDKANSQLQTRFSPQLNQLAGGFLARLTNGRYDTIFVGQSMEIQTRETGKIPTLSPLVLSGGTAEQLYLAVRLAMSTLVLGEHAPLILDDALAFFDDSRATDALCLLSELAEHRQVLLFTCHNREKTILNHSN